MLKTILTAALLSSPLLASEVSEVGLRSARNAFKAFTPSGTTWLDELSTQLEVHHDAKPAERGNLAVFWDLATGYYAWHLYPVQDPADTFDLASPATAAGTAFYVERSGLYLLSMATDLAVLLRPEKASSLDAAKTAAIEEIRRGLTDFEKNGYDPGFVEVPVGAAIGRRWACPADDEPGGMNPLCQFGPKAIPSVTRDGENWKIVARNRWDEEITLGSDFHLIGVRALPR